MNFSAKRTHKPIIRWNAHNFFGQRGAPLMRSAYPRVSIGLSAAGHKSDINGPTRPLADCDHVPYRQRMRHIREAEIRRPPSRPFREDNMSQHSALLNNGHLLGLSVWADFSWQSPFEWKPCRKRKACQHHLISYFLLFVIERRIKRLCRPFYRAQALEMLGCVLFHHV